MSDHTEDRNYGAKGRFILYVIIALTLFIALIVWIYRMNMQDVVPVG